MRLHERGLIGRVKPSQDVWVGVAVVEQAGDAVVVVVVDNDVLVA